MCRECIDRSIKIDLVSRAASDDRLSGRPRVRASVRPFVRSFIRPVVPRSSRVRRVEGGRRILERTDRTTSIDDVHRPRERRERMPRAREALLLLAIVAIVAIGRVSARDDDDDVIIEARRIAARDDADDAVVRLARFAPCDATDRFDACFESEVVDGDADATCEVVEGRIRDASGVAMDDACGTVDAVGTRVVARARTRDGCARGGGGVYRIEARVVCRGRNRVFPYSTLLLGEVVALADATIYLAEAAHALEDAVDGEEAAEAEAEEEHERGTEFTIYWPASF